MPGQPVRWRPILLGAVFKAAGNEMPARVRAKAQWMGRDLDLWAELYGVPFAVKDNTPIANLFVSLLDKVGVHLESFADSQGKVDGLFEPMGI